MQNYRKFIIAILTPLAGFLSAQFGVPESVLEPAIPTATALLVWLVPNDPV